VSPFDTFAREQMRHLGQTARRLRIPAHEAEEMLQEVLVRLWQADVERDRWEGWVWAAMAFRRLTYLRTTRRHARLEAAVVEHIERQLATPPPDVVTYQRECELELAGLAEQLGPARREVVRLYLLEEVPMTEVAARLGVSENTAKDRWRLAQIDMRAAWDRQRARERWRMAVDGVNGRTWP
jgi:RNA polymerase sigma factor (sigma-70 family)